MIDIHNTVLDAEKNVNKALDEYENSEPSVKKDFLELKLQSCIFQYEMCREVFYLKSFNPTDFASYLALKNIVLKLYEYDAFVNSKSIPNIIKLAQKRNVPIDSKTIKLKRKQWREDLKKINRWSKVRNEAAHYTQNIETQIYLLKSLKQDEVMQIFESFLRFNHELNLLLREIGQGNIFQSPNKQSSP